MEAKVFQHWTGAQIHIYHCTTLTEALVQLKKAVNNYDDWCYIGTKISYPT